MKMKKRWSKPPLQMKHRGKRIYSVYKDGGYDFFYQNIFTTSCDCDDHHAGRFRFDVRNLKGYIPPATARFEDGLAAIEAAFKMAIETGELEFPS